MKIIVIGLPENLPPELAENPDVIVIDPQQLGDDTMAALNAASGGLALEDEKGGEGALVDWAQEEEAEHAHSGEGPDDESFDDDEDEKKREGMGRGRGGRAEGDRDSDMLDERGGEGDDEDEYDERGGEGDDEDEYDDEDDDKPSGTGRGRMGRGKGGRGRGALMPPLAAWARNMVGGRGRIR